MWDFEGLWESSEEIGVLGECFSGGCECVGPRSISKQRDHRFICQKTQPCSIVKMKIAVELMQ